MKTTISAFTAERVTGNMKVINWGKYAAKCTHLKGIQFRIPGIRPIVDLLIGVDNLLNYTTRSRMFEVNLENQ